MREKEYTLGSIISVFVIINTIALLIAALGYQATL